jgi:hypothetical protein
MLALRWRKLLLIAWAGLLCLAAAGALAQDAADAQPIRDNSFLVEEAYNQEPGVVQHIFNLYPAWEHGKAAERTVDFLFTQEWPVFSQRHQFSYTIPMRRIREDPEMGIGAVAWGLDDIMLNYRFQALSGDNKAFPLAVAPRFSFIFPSSNLESEANKRKLGYQINLPLSYELEKWAFHFNAGLTKSSNVLPPGVPGLPFLMQTADGYNLGLSAIYFLRPHFNLMLETVAFWDEEFLPGGGERMVCETILLPGFRWAPYTEGDTQWVLGCGVPIGLSAAAPDIGVFFYMSFEHRFWRQRTVTR